MRAVSGPAGRYSYNILGKMGLRAILLGATGALLLTACGPLLPDNRTDGHADDAKPQFSVGDVVFSSESNVSGALWAEIPRSSGDGTVGAYVSTNLSSRTAWVMLLDGAATVSLDGNVQQALYFQETFGSTFEKAGFRTIALVTSECGGAYATRDLQDVVDAVDWLQSTGKAELGVDRLYVIGYSMGAMLATQLNLYRSVDGIVAISPLTEPNQFEDNYYVYRLIADNFRTNEGICQLKSTIEDYGLPGESGWKNLDVVSRVRELRAPMLMVHGERDVVLFPENTHDMQKAYDAALADGAKMPPIDFMFVPDAGHFDAVTDPEIAIRAIEFVENREVDWLRKKFTFAGAVR